MTDSFEEEQRARRERLQAWLDPIEEKNALHVLGWIDAYDQIQAKTDNDLLKLYHPPQGKRRGWRWDVRRQEFMDTWITERINREESEQIMDWLDRNGYVYPG